MSNFRVFKKLSHDDRGATAIEYGLIAALIVIAMIAALAGLGGQNAGGWGSFSTKANTAMAAAG